MNYIFGGVVIKGEGYGRKIGFPTLNIDRRSFSRLKVKPVLGVYSGMVTLQGKLYKAGIIIGPVDKKGRAKGRAGLPKLEAHLIGYGGNAYGKKAVFEVNKFIRKFKKFKTEKELIIRIKKDLKKC